MLPAILPFCRRHFTKKTAAGVKIRKKTPLHGNEVEKRAIRVCVPAGQQSQFLLVSRISPKLLGMSASAHRKAFEVATWMKSAIGCRHFECLLRKLFQFLSSFLQYTTCDQIALIASSRKR